MLLLDNVRDRRFVVLLGVIPDIDGVFILFDMDLFREYHHTFGHSLLFGLPLLLGMLVFAKKKMKFAIAGALGFIMHLAADVVGSNWAITPLYPLSERGVDLNSYLSNAVIYGVINPAAFLVVMLAVAVLVFRMEVSPLEFFSTRLDRWIVHYYTNPLKYRCELCGKRAFSECSRCGRKICARHTVGLVKPKCKECVKGKK